VNGAAHEDKRVTTASADFSLATPRRCRLGCPARPDGGEISQGKSWLLRSVLAGFTTVRVRMTIGPPRPLPGYPTTLALYPVSVRRVRVGGIGFLRIPSRDRHPCL